MPEYSGRKLRIRYCEEPPSDADLEKWQPASWREALGHIPGGKHAGIWAKIAARRHMLAETGRLRSPDYWNTEGDLPNGKKFYAIKADRIRAYGWFSNRDRGVFYISHFAFKKGKKLAAEDTNRVIRNWRAIEE